LQQGQKFTSKAFKVDPSAVSASTGEQKKSIKKSDRVLKVATTTARKSMQEKPATSPVASARMSRIARLNRKKLQRTVSQREKNNDVPSDNLVRSSTNPNF